MNILILPTNKSFMPYLDLYGDLCGNGINIVWDRFNSEVDVENKVVYRDKKNGHRRNFIDYLRFAFFTSKWLLVNASKFDRVQIFGSQLTFFLWPVLFFKSISYSIDYRDFHILTRFTPKFVYNRANFIAISSPGYKSLFTNAENIVMSHNFKSVYSHNIYKKPSNRAIVVSCIGAIRDFVPNSELILKLNNDERFVLNFHGAGIAVADLIKLTQKLGSKNVNFTGFYDKKDEPGLYFSSDIINLLRYSDSYNDQVALPNRLYNAAQSYTPILCYKGTLLADYVEKFNLGLVLEYNVDFSVELLRYLESFNTEIYEEGVSSFLSTVEEEQIAFKRAYSAFFNFY